MAQRNLGRVVGKDGITPHIGVNGNWWVGENDTGVKAQASEQKLYDTAGQATDGSMTQKAATDEINNKINRGGDTMTGQLIVNGTLTARGGVNGSQGRSMISQDSTETSVGSSAFPLSLYSSTQVKINQPIDINSSGVNSTFGALNGSYTHFQSDATNGFHFNNRVQVQSDIGVFLPGTGYRRVIDTNGEVFDIGQRVYSPNNKPTPNAIGAVNTITTATTDDPNTTTEPLILTSHVNCPPAGPSGRYYFIRTYFFSDYAAARQQIAYAYAANDVGNKVYVRNIRTGAEWSSWTEVYSSNNIPSDVSNAWVDSSTTIVAYAESMPTRRVRNIICANVQDTPSTWGRATITTRENLNNITIEFMEQSSGRIFTKCKRDGTWGSWNEVGALHNPPPSSGGKILFNGASSSVTINLSEIENGSDDEVVKVLEISAGCVGGYSRWVYGTIQYPIRNRQNYIGYNLYTPSTYYAQGFGSYYNADGPIALSIEDWGYGYIAVHFANHNSKGEYQHSGEIYKVSVR